MWKQILEYTSKLFLLMQRVDRLEAAAEDLREEIKEIHQKIDRLTDLLTRLGFELMRDRENAQRDREIQRLTLENALLRIQQGLPPIGGNELPE